jgi:hypothetical protein
VYQSSLSIRCGLFFAIIGSVLLFCESSEGQTAGKQTVPGSVPAAVGNLHLAALRDLPLTNHMRLAIGLPLRNQGQLNQLLGQLYDPHSTNYHHYLTPQEFTARFGPSAEDYAGVINFAKANGLKVEGTYSNRTVVDVSGDAAAVGKAFHVRLREYRHPVEDRNFFAPDGEPSVDLAVPLLHIEGLNNFVIPRPALIKKSQLSSVSPALGSGTNGMLKGSDFRNAYIPGVTLNGAGQTVGLFELDGYYTNDVIEYEQYANLPAVPLTNIYVDNYSGAAGSGNTEVALDIDMVVSLATNLTQVIVYEEANPGNVLDLLTRIATDNLAKQISSSWLVGDSSSYDTEYVEMAMQGQTFFQASGDDGAYYSSFRGAIPEWADDPNITIVGGTTLSMNGNGDSYLNEVVWNWYSSGSGSAASGGGVNFNGISLPTWQSGVATTANKGSTSRRDVPDVAMNADNIFIWADNGAPQYLGGTSAAAPLWAAFNALANERAAIFGHSLMGFLNPTIYSIGKGAGYATNFYDITTGSNSTPQVTTKYPATTGYDLCTGWGSPIGSNLLNTLVPPDSLAITPLMGFTFSGPAGGPFNSATQTYYLTNSSANVLDWSLVNTSSWLNASVTGGELTAGSSTNEVIGVGPGANSLGLGTYTASLQFSNRTSHIVQTLPFSLRVFDALLVTQPGSFAANGPYGGPFSPASQTFSITNSAPVSFNWSLINTSLWLNASTGGGVLGADGATNVLFSIGPAANTLPLGTYVANILFSNWNSQIAQNFSLTLQVTEPLLIAPVGNFSAGGISGGPFSATSEAFTLTNLGNAAISWQLVNTSAWLNVSAPGGVLGGGGTTNVVAGLDMNASNLVAGAYTATLAFDDQTLGTTQNRQFSLLIGQSAVLNGGFETGDFTDWTLNGDPSPYNFVDNGSVATAIHPHSGTYFAALGESGFQGYLSQTLPTVPGAAYLLSLWMNSPNVNPYQPNEFSVAWNGNTLFDQLNLPPITSPASGWTNLQFIVTATNAASVLQIGGRDDDYYLGLDDVSLSPIPPAALQSSLAANTSGVTFSWNAVTGLVYQVQYSTNLFAPNWVTLQNITATNTAISFTDSNSVSSQPQKFYRLLLLP